VEKVALTSEIHGDSGSLRCSNHLVISDRPARLHHSPHSRINQQLQAIGKGEKGIGRGDAAGGPLSRSGHCELTRIHTVDLAHSNTYTRATLGEQYSIGFHGPDCSPCKLQGRKVRGASLITGDQCPGGGISKVSIYVLN
jgi:hypothetical protein